MEIRYLLGARLNEVEKSYLEKKILKVEKLLGEAEKADELFAEADVSLDKKGFFRVELMIKTPKKLYRVEKTEATFSEAVDFAENALLSQIRRQNEKTRDIHRKRKFEM